MLDTIAEYIGTRQAARLVACFGGEAIKFPVKSAGAVWQRLVACIGEADASVLREVFSGETVYVAINHAAMVEANRRRAAELRAAGMPWRDVARAMEYTVRYTERGARKLLEGQWQHATQAQMDMFTAELIHDESAHAMP